MIQFITSSIINYITWVVLGTGVALVISLLDRQNDELIPNFISAIIGATAGGILSSLIFGEQITMSSLSAVFLVLTGAFLLSILTKLLRTQTEQEVQLGGSANTRQNSYEYAYFSDVKKEKPNHKKDIKNIIEQAEFPLSNRDLVRLAEKSEADRTDLTFLESLPDHIYQTKEEILELFS